MSRKPARSIPENFVPRTSHVRRALVTGSTVTNRLALTLPSILIPMPYIVNGMSEPTIATAREAVSICMFIWGKVNVLVTSNRMMEANREAHPITLTSPYELYNFCG